MSQPRRGIRVTLVTALLTALVATVAAPSVFAANATLSVSPAATYVASGATDTLTVTASGLTSSAMLTLTPTSGTVATTIAATTTGTISATVLFTAPVNTGSTPVTVTFSPSDTAGDTFTFTTPAVLVAPAAGTLGANGYLEAYPATLKPDGVSVSTITVNPFGKVVGTAGSSLNLSTTAGTFQTVVTNSLWTTSPTVTTLGVSGTVGTPTGTATISLVAPTTVAAATIQLIDNNVVLDTVTVTFTKPAPGQGNTEREHGKGAQKVAFYASTGATTCAAAPVSPSAGTPSFGFAILNTTGHGRVNVEVSLKGAAPNSTYSVYLDQAGACSPAFTLHTNSRGNGNRHLNLAMVSGATQAWLTAVQTAGPTVANGSNLLVTNLAMVSVKGHGHEHAQGNQDKGGNQDNPGRGHGKG